MRIYFTGSHGIGKSTLSKYFSEKYKLNMLSEVARMVLSGKELHIDSLRSNLDVVNDYQSSIFHRQLQEENKYKDFVSDRSILDCLAYSCQHASILSELINSEELKLYIEELKKPDVFIFFIRPIKAALVQDGVRETISWDGIVSIDGMIKFLLEMNGLRYFQINTDNMQERVRLINAILSTSII